MTHQEMIDLLILAKKIVEDQRKDDDLWVSPQTITEEYLQAALKRLHAHISKG